LKASEKNNISESEELVEDDEVVTNERDWEPAEDDYIPYQEEEQVITDRDAPASTTALKELIKLGLKIKKHGNAVQRGQTEGKQSRCKTKNKTTNRGKV
jgi:hypothetical protein